MKSLPALLLMVAFLVLVGWGPLTGCDVVRPAHLAHRGTTKCPPDTLYHIDAYRWPNFAALRFVRDGKPLIPPGSLTQRTCGDWGLDEQFRFGAFYFIDNTPANGLAGRVERMVWCAQGRDTMRVVFWPYYQQNVFYDSIPFRPGTFLLYDPWGYGEKQAQHYGSLPTYSFGAYYAGHAAGLARQNVFANLYFHDVGPCCRPNNKVPGAPDTPAQIFESLLQRTSYVGVRWTRLVPIHEVAKPVKYVKEYYEIYRADNPADSAVVANP